MKTLHLYLLRQVIATLLVTVAVFTFVLLLVNVLNEILSLLMHHQATFGTMGRAVGLLIPFVMVFALPMGMLTAALLVFGRFSADQELTAVRSSGISLVALITPILLLSLLLCALSAWINMQIAPECRVAYKKLIDEMKLKVSSEILPEGRFVKDFPGYMFYITRNDGEYLRGVYICHLSGDADQIIDQTYIARHGTVEMASNGCALIKLYDVDTRMRMTNGTWVTGFDPKFTLQSEPRTNNVSDSKPQISDMTFRQLQAELRDLERGFSLPHQSSTGSAELKKQLQQVRQMKRDMATMILVQMHRQVASAFACFGFTLVGIALGIRAHRRETNMGIFFTLVLVLIYYGFMIIAQSLQTHPELTPYLIYWVPNFLFQIVGAVLLWRVNKGV